MVKAIGLSTALALIIANTVGAGILTTSGYLARDIGSQTWIMSLWLVGGFLALCGAYCYGALAKQWPISGGEYNYIRAVFGPRLAFLSGWTSLTLGFGAAIAASALGLAEYFIAWTNWPPSPWLAKIIALACLCVLSVMHSHSLQRSQQVQLLFTGLKLMLLIVVFAWAAMALPDADVVVITPQKPPAMSQIGSGLIYVMYAYSGWNAINYIAAEVRGGARTIAWSLLMGCGLITALYVAINSFYFAALPMAELAAEPVLPVAKKALAATLGEGVGRWFALAVVLSIASAMSAMIWLAPKVYQQMAKDGLAPAMLQSTNTDQVPQTALVLQSGWAGLLIITGSFDQLLIFSGAPLLVFSAIAVACVWAMDDKPAPSVALAAILFIAITILSLMLLIVAKPFELIGAVITVGLGLPIYYYLSAQPDYKEF